MLFNWWNILFVPFGSTRTSIVVVVCILAYHCLLVVSDTISLGQSILLFIDGVFCKNKEETC